MGNTGESIAYELALVSPPAPIMICEMGSNWLYNCCFVECCFQELLKTVCRNVEFLCSCHWASFLSISLESKWYNYKIVLTQLQNERNPVLFYQRSVFNMIYNLSIATHTFPGCILISVNEILLPRSMNWSTNFRVLPLKVEMALSCLKYMNSVLFVFM